MYLHLRKFTNGPKYNVLDPYCLNPLPGISSMSIKNCNIFLLRTTQGISKLQERPPVLQKERPDFFQSIFFLPSWIRIPNLEQNPRPIKYGPNLDPDSKHCCVQHTEQSTGMLCDDRFFFACTGQLWLVVVLAFFSYKNFLHIDFFVFYNNSSSHIVNVYQRVKS
jgi:hypothetical protein